MSSSSVEEYEVPKFIETLFLRFSAIYGHVWRSIYKNENYLLLTKKEWGSALKGYDVRVIRESLLACREKAVYPPSLPQFIEYCQAFKKRSVFIYRAKKDDFKPSNPEIAKKHLHEIKLLIR